MQAGKNASAHSVDNPLMAAKLTASFRAAWTVAGEAQKKLIAEELFVNDLETIVLPKALKDPAKNPLLVVKILYKAGPPEPNTYRITRTTQAGQKRKVGFVDLLSDSGTDNGPQNNPDDEYRRLQKEGKKEMMYHDIKSAPGKWPGPEIGLRLLLEKFNAAHGIKDTLKGCVPKSLVASAINQYTYNGPLTQDDMRWWLEERDRGGPRLLRGFPLVENVTFLRHANFWDEAKGEKEITDGMCYWTATAMHMYGNPWMWLRVKKEHREHFDRVLRSPKHPKHGLFKALNEKWYSTTIMGSPYTLNLWQILNLPETFTPAAILDVTADLYNVYTVMYSYNSSQHPLTVYETQTRGAYNSRHLFYLFTNDCHYQPMVPNEYIHWEFKHPRITKYRTHQLPLAGGERDGIYHPWRSEFGRTFAQCGPSLIRRYRGGHDDAKDPKFRATHCCVVGINPLVEVGMPKEPAKEKIAKPAVPDDPPVGPKPPVPKLPPALVDAPAAPKVLPAPAVAPVAVPAAAPAAPAAPAVPAVPVAPAVAVAPAAPPAAPVVPAPPATPAAKAKPAAKAVAPAKAVRAKSAPPAIAPPTKGALVPKAAPAAKVEQVAKAARVAKAAPAAKAAPVAKAVLAAKAAPVVAAEGDDKDEDDDDDDGEVNLTDIRKRLMKLKK